MNENPGRTGGRAIVVALMAFIVVGIGWLFWARGRTMSRPIPAVAVLPFRNTSPGFEYFTDGLTIELTDALSRVEKLRVTSWNSAARFRGMVGNLQQLRDQLQAGSVVDGTFRRQGDRLLIMVKLIDANGGETIWSGTYDRQEREIFQIQEEIAKSIVYALKVPLRMDPQRILVPPRTQSMDAANDYLRARVYKGQFSREGLAKSSEFAEKAIAEDPKYSPPYALLAANYGLVGPLTGERLAKAKSLARKTIEMDPSSGEAHAALGMSLGIGDWDWKGARLELERAVQWSPGSPDAHAAMALGYLMPAGDLDSAEYEARKAVELDPLSFFANCTLGKVLLARNSYQESIERFRMALTISGEFGYVHRDYATALAAAGQKDLAVAELAKGAGGVGSSMNWMEVARSKAVAGDFDAAFAALERAVEQRDPEAVFLKSDIQLANLRKDPRYGALLRRLKLPL